ncbi:MAG: efflux transporter outer membrane subunit, partial [Rhodoferax sp.]|nr:efflux transporter outer membrane subunit [Rhodoferax sp.]
KQVSARSALLPEVSAEASASRSQQALTPQGNIVQAGFKASWELDLVGANRAVSQAAVAQVEATQALWHDARVSVAAEVANLYYAQASCMQLLQVAEQDAASRRETMRLAERSTQAGFTAPATAALARASAADSNSRLTLQAAQCDINTKALVALTALPEAALRSKLSAAFAKGVLAQPLAVNRVPAQTIAQRPDVFAAERDVVLAAAAVGSAKAQRYPRVMLNGSIAAARLGNNGTDFTDSIWSVGPLTLSLPLFDGGQRSAAVQSNEAAYRSSITAYQATVRQAVREVEVALVNLQSTEARANDAGVSVQGYAESLAATQQRYQQGFASLMELEDARRLSLAAQSAQLALQAQRNQAWVSLYRALGGGFEPVTQAASAQKPG